MLVIKVDNLNLTSGRPRNRKRTHSARFPLTHIHIGAVACTHPHIYVHIQNKQINLIKIIFSIFFFWSGKTQKMNRRKDVLGGLGAWWVKDLPGKHYGRVWVPVIHVKDGCSEELLYSRHTSVRMGESTPTLILPSPLSPPPT